MTDLTELTGYIQKVPANQKSETLMVYVDGFNLYHGVHELSGRKHLWLDLVSLSRSLRPRSQLLKVKYFTASVLNEPAAQSRQDTYIAALKAHHPGEMEVTMGRYQQKTRTCRHCRKPWHLYEEKETDLNIAVNIVADAAAGAADSFMVITGDSDIAPAIRMAQKLNPNAFFVAGFPPKRFSAELQTVMPASFHIGRQKVLNAQLPEQIVDAAGNILHERPVKWT